MSTLRDEIKALIMEICDPQTPDLSDPDANLLKVGVDSIDFASILMAVEETFSVSIGNEAMEQLGTVNALAAFVEANC